MRFQRKEMKVVSIYFFRFICDLFFICTNSPKSMRLLQGVEQILDSKLKLDLCNTVKIEQKDSTAPP